jgi:serpin B
MEATVLESDLDRETDPDVPADDLDALVRGNTAFGIALHDHLVEGTPGENLLTSPYSVSVAPAMTWAGARGTTAEQMADALRFRLPEDQQHPAFNDLDQRLERSAEAEADDDETPFTLETANAVWGQRDYPFADAYLDTLAANYGAGLRALDFTENPEAAREAINHWVAEATEGTIEDLLPEGIISELTRLVLTNAIYFRASWAKAFEADDTEDATLTALDGTESTVPMMHLEEDVPHAEVDGTQVVELPYVGEDVGMAFVLPPDGEFRSSERSLDAARLHELFDATESKHGVVEIPKFSYGSKASLKDALSALGMPDALDPDRSNFGGMTDPPDPGEDLYVHDVVHETHVAVDEEGTEASAATGVVVNTTSAPMVSFEFVADRPFLYAIRHRPTDAVLFLGRVVDAGDAQG